MIKIETVDVGGSQMPVLLGIPDTPGPHPGLVIGHHGLSADGFENDPFTNEYVARLNENGYAAAVPLLFHRCPDHLDRPAKVGTFKDEEIVQDLKAAYDLLDRSEAVDSNRIGSLGHCLGGRAAWLGAATNPAFKVLVIFHGGNILKPWGHEGDAPIAMAGNIKCPVVGFFGNDDENPSPADVDAYGAALDEAGGSYVFHRYDGTGHAFQNTHDDGKYRESSANDAWDKQFAFLAENL